MHLGNVFYGDPDLPLLSVECVGLLPQFPLMQPTTTHPFNAICGECGQEYLVAEDVDAARESEDEDDWPSCESCGGELYGPKSWAAEVAELEAECDEEQAILCAEKALHTAWRADRDEDPPKGSRSMEHIEDYAVQRIFELQHLVTTTPPWPQRRLPVCAPPEEDPAGEAVRAPLETLLSAWRKALAAWVLAGGDDGRLKKEGLLEGLGLELPEQQEDQDV